MARFLSMAWKIRKNGFQKNSKYLKKHLSGERLIFATLFLTKGALWHGLLMCTYKVSA